jgi:tellurite resistance protein TehA-like permease
VKPDVFAAVMATGIVSIAAADHGHHTISDILLVLAAVGLPVLVLTTVMAWRRTPLDFGTPEAPIQLLTFVAACAVVGTRLEWIPWLHRSLAIVAALGWLVLLPTAVRAMWRCRWTGLRDRARGGGELVSVATSGLAILAADFGATDLAIGLVALALCFYIAMTGLVVWRAAHRPWAADLLQPDMWILMGAVAIATLAGDQIDKAGVEGIRPVTIVTWIVATVWIPPLILVGAQRIRRRREVAPGMLWAAVFPLGMYSSATFASAVATGWADLKTISLVVLWIALAAWVLAAVGWLMQFRANGLARKWRLSRCGAK